MHYVYLTLNMWQTQIYLSHCLYVLGLNMHETLATEYLADLNLATPLFSCSRLDFQHLLICTFEIVTVFTVATSKSEG